ncbi:MAG: hypothetical protein ACYDD4_03665 [Acidimicrobiales bacterium]
MKRRAFDFFLSVGGLAIVVILVAAGSLGMWAANYASSNVHNQLAAQQIFFPSAAAFAHPTANGEITSSMIPSVSQYAGQQLLTGPQAKAYADDFIAVHLREISGGKTYAQLSTAALALPKGTPAYTAAEAQVQTLFQGTTLRGLLLEAYAFGTIGEVAQVAAVIAFILAGIMLLLTVFGFLHLRRVPEEQEIPVSPSVRHALVGA